VGEARIFAADLHLVHHPRRSTFHIFQTMASLFQVHNKAILRYQANTPSVHTEASQLMREAINGFEYNLRYFSTEANNEEIALSRVRNAVNISVIDACNSLGIDCSDLFHHYFTMKPTGSPQNSIIPQETIWQPLNTQRVEVPNESTAAACLALCLFNLALMRHLKHTQSLLLESELFKTAELYESSFSLLLRVSEVGPEDPLALVCLAICTNLTSLYLEIGNLQKSGLWASALKQEQYKTSLAYHTHIQHRLGRRHIMRSIQLTSSAQSPNGARAA